MSLSRRVFLESLGRAALAAVALPAFAGTAGRRVPVGLELYTVDNAMKKDFDGTLQQIAAIGYREVEFPWYYGRKAPQVAAALKSHGLRCRSGLCTFEELEADLPARIAFAKEAGFESLGCVMIPLPESRDIAAAIDRLTLDDFHRYADRFNEMGVSAKRAGLRFTYHNHDFEFRKFGDVVGYDELLRRTDPTLVGMEMDVGWVVHAGYDPVRYLRANPGRISLLHVRDLKRDSAPKALEMHSVEVGRGVIDWGALLTAAADAGVVAGFVEQDPADPPTSIASARASFEYLNRLSY